MQKILKTEVYVKNEKEALLLAAKYKKENKYDIFRGQKRRWDLVSSLSRIDDKKRELAYTRLNRFGTWVYNNNINDLFEDKDKILSVAQHYGLPTSFIDFTYNPEVALFFATYGANSLKIDGCIYCASKKELASSIVNFNNTLKKANFRILELEVGNLWRLQSQEGLFLDAPIAGFDYWEDFFPFHKIIFPHTKSFKNTINKHIIYPQRKSILEIKLDQYFREEEVQEGLNRFEEITKAKPILTPWESNFSIFKNGEKPTPDPKWMGSENANWESKNFERYRDTVHIKKHTIVIDEKIKTPADVNSIFSKSMFQLIEEDNTIKRHAVDFKLLFDQNIVKWPAEMIPALELFWDGVRQFPYSNKEISEGFGNLAAMWYSSSINPKDYMVEVFGETSSFDCIVKKGGHFRVALPVGPLTKCINPLLLDQVDQMIFPISEVFDLIYHIHDIEILFNFNDFKTFLVTCLIPCQIICNLDPTQYYSGDHDEHTLVVFSPFEFQSIRYALASFTYSKRYRNEENIIAVDPILKDDELITLMAEALNNIEKGSRPITITISGFQNDSREIYNIPEVKAFCKRLLKIGFVSIQEVTTNFREISDAYNPYTLGAFEVWLLANGKMSKTMDMLHVQSSFELFYNQLSNYNLKCDEVTKDVKDNLNEDKLNEIKMTGSGFMSFKTK